MLVKPPKKSNLILTLESLLRRIPADHPKRLDLENYLSRLLAGFQGEKSLEYYFKFLPEKDYYIFHHLRLPYLDAHFQIDYLIYSAKFILVSEVKSFSGNVYLDKNFNQLIQRKDEEIKAYPDPITQVSHQRYQLEQLLKNQKFSTSLKKTLPIEKLVIFTNPNTVIEASENYIDAFKYVIRKENFLPRMNQLQQKYKYEVLDQKAMKKLSRLLLKLHIEERIDVFNKFDIKEEEILKGVRCTNEECGKFHMIRKRGVWACPHCQHHDKYAHLEALKDYEQIISMTITNKQCREFLKINCRHTTKRILHSLNYKITGGKKNRTYHLHFLEKNK